MPTDRLDPLLDSDYFAAMAPYATRRRWWRPRRSVLLLAWRMGRRKP